MAAPATATATKPPQPDVKPTAREDDDLREELLRQITSLPRNNGNITPGVVEKHFVIQHKKPIPELDTQLAKAYAVRDERDAARQLYALVCNPKMPVRAGVIKALLGVTVPGMVTLHAAGLTEITGQPGFRYVLVYDRPLGKSLAAIMEEKKGAVPEQFIIEQVAATVGHIIQFFTEQGLSHGRINPQNIFFGETLMLGECACEPCGYSQPWQFETPDRAQAFPAGKGESLPAHDFFSLGVTAAYLRLGARMFDRAPTQEAHIMRMLQYGSYVAIMQNIEFSDAMTDLLRGTLHDSPGERWTWQQMRPWCKGRRYNMLPPAEPAAAMRPMLLENVEYHNLRMMSQGLCTNWEAGLRLLQDGSLVRWVELSVRRKDIAEILRRALASLNGPGARSAHQTDEMVSRAITILDPQAPLSRKDVRAHAVGMGCLVAEGYRTGATHYIQNTLDMIEQGLTVVWADMYRRNDETLPSDVTNTLWLLDRLRVVLRIPGYGFGVERVLYDLNPDLPCQSPLLEDYHAATLRDLLIALDRLAASRGREGTPFDRHIAGFISSKLALPREAHLSEYNHIPRLAKHKAFVALRLFEQAQEACGRPKVQVLTAWLSVQLLGAIELFHSKSARGQLYAGLRQLADNGFFAPISAYINQRAFAATDLDGFREAIEFYFKTSQEVAELRDKRKQKMKASISGYGVAKYIAHMGLLIAAIMVFREYVK